MERFCRGVILSGLLLLSGFQAKAKTEFMNTARHHDLPVKTSEIRWSKLVWYSATVGGRKVAHAAPFIEIHVDGMARPALMELDTGTDVTSLYGKTLPRAMPSLQSRDIATLSGTMAGCPFANQEFQVLADQGDAPDADGPIYLGTVGLGFFKNRVLLMDLVSNRVAILPEGTELPASVASRAQFVPADNRGGKLYVTLTANGEIERNMFFDTGSSSSSLVTAPMSWKRLTGRKPGDPRNSRWGSSNWGKNAVMVSAPMSGNVCVASACIPRPTIKFESTGLRNFDFANYPTKTEGYFGLVLFDGRFTVIVDVPHGRFGLVRGSVARQLQGR
jgi:hypothetical protein